MRLILSQGGLIAALVAGIADDPILQENIKRQLNGWSSDLNSFACANSSDEDMEPGQIDKVLDEFGLTKEDHHRMVSVGNNLNVVNR